MDLAVPGTPRPTRRAGGRRWSDPATDLEPGGQSDGLAPAEKTVPLKHFVRPDMPPGRPQRAVCGRLVGDRETASLRDDVSCDRCLRWLAEFEAMTI